MNMTGRVVSVKSQKTATVLVESSRNHPLYKKSMTKTKKYLVHDLMGVALGDVVEIVKIRPISKRKHWQIVRKVGQDMVAIGTAEMKELAQETIEEVLPEEKAESESVEEAAAAEVVAEPKTKAKPKKEAKK